METPPAPPRRPSPDRDAARRVVEAARQEKRDWLMEHEAKSVLAAYGVPTTDDVLAATPEAAADAARRIGAPVAIKIVSPDITHKSDVGGVALDLATPEDAAAETEAMFARVRAAVPDAHLLGVNVQRMVRQPGAHELIAGMTVDGQFGPVMLFGHGGTAVEVIGDKALELPPLNLRLARRMMERTRIHRLLTGYRGQPPAALDEIARTLVAVADLIVDLDMVAELDINPLLADESGVIALDARMRIATPPRLGVARLAIRPYPRELERRASTPDGLAVFLRPIRPEDEPALKEAYAHMSGEAIRMRFFAAMAEVPHALLARLTQIDYDREMAFVAFADSDTEQKDILAVARFAAEPDGQRAEYAVEVRTDQAGKGLGETVMRHLIEVAKSRGIAVLYGAVLAENQAMIRLAQKLGMRVLHDSSDPNVVTTTLSLFAEASA